jgi:hypothetical protein
MILEEWKKRKAQYEKKLLAKQMDYSSSNDASNNLIKDKLMKVFSHSVKNRLDELKKEQQRRMSTPFMHWGQSKLNMQKQKQGKMGLSRLSMASKGPIDLANKFKGALLDDIQMRIKNENKDEVDVNDFRIIEDEGKIIEAFLNKFLILPESGVID